MCKVLLLLLIPTLLFAQPVAEKVTIIKDGVEWTRVKEGALAKKLRQGYYTKVGDKFVLVQKKQVDEEGKDTRWITVDKTTGKEIEER